MSKGTVQVGEILPDICQMWLAAMNECIEQNKHRREPYYIFFHADWYRQGSQMKLNLSPRDTCPPRMLNTGCFRIDNVSGSVKELWTWPKDAPTGDAPVGEVIDDQELIDDARALARQGMIIY